MRHPAILIFLVTSTISLARAGERFNAFWYDGNAEIATYALNESRYGEMHEGTRVMVFVTEPLRMSTLIKPDIRLPADSVVKVIKLNDHREFVTGIYDYSVMTSTFHALENIGVFKPGDAVKVAFSAQEWCGMVYEKMVRQQEDYSGVIYSYFESEGEREYSIPHNNTVVPEENLWILIRELQGQFLEDGTEKKIELIPSIWGNRKNHIPGGIKQGFIRKGKLQTFDTRIGKIRGALFAWGYDGKTTTAAIESAYPHRILSFAEMDGSRGTILSTRRVPYWKLHANKDLHYRTELGLTK